MSEAPAPPLPRRRHPVRWDEPARAGLRILLPLYVAAIAGTLAVPATVLTYRTASAASVQDVERNRAVIARVERAQYETCLKINGIADHAGIPVDPCDPPGPAR